MTAVTPSYIASGHAVARTNELLACAKTALRLAHEHQSKITSQSADLSNNKSDAVSSHYASGTSVAELRLWSPNASSSSGNFDDPYQYHSLEQDDAFYLTLSPPEKAIHDASQLLNVLDSLVAELQSLVRRRGHTNDPTEEIGTCMRRFQSLMSEFVKEVEAIPTAVSCGANDSKGRTKQRTRHYEVVAQDLLSQGKRRTASFQEALEKRGEVLKEQAQRRKILSTGASENCATAAAFSSALANDNGVVNTGPSSGRNATIGVVNRPYGTLASSFYSASSTPSQLNAPLFTRTSGSVATMSRKKNTGISKEGSAAPMSEADKERIFLEDASIHSRSLNSSGMRQRRKATQISSDLSKQINGSGNTYSSSAYASAYKTNGYDPHLSNNMEHYKAEDVSNKTQIQLQHRRQARETKARLENARQAERAIYELGNMFSKMATLIHSQAQHIEKIEDDVELANHDVNAGHEEITKLFDITKGNRSLIVKVFVILIVMILFLRLY